MLQFRKTKKKIMQQHQGLLSWNLLPPPPPLTHLSQFPRKSTFFSVSATIVSETPETILTGRERRQMRNERRESKLTGTGWREQVEDKLLIKPKKRYKSWTEELNLDTLSTLGPQWWIIRVSRISGQETAERVARALIRNFPDIEFKVQFSFFLLLFILLNALFLSILGNVCIDY